MTRVEQNNSAFLRDEARKLWDEDPYLSVQDMVRMLARDYDFGERYVRNAIREVIGE